MASDRSALITGASGFVGRHLLAALRQQGWRVVALRRPTSGPVVPEESGGFETVILHDAGDLPAILDRARVETIFHLAAYQSRGHGHHDIDAFVEANLRLGMHLFEAAAHRGVQVVSALSYSQYRDGQPAANTLYSATKQAQAEFARFWRERTGADIRDVVLFDNYGTDDTRDKLIPGLIRAARSGEPLTIGPLEQVIDLLHVRDVATGLIASTEGSHRGPFTVRASEFVTVGTLVDLVGQVAGVRVPVSVDPARLASDGPMVAGTWEPPVGWSPEVPLPFGIAECVMSAT